MVRDPSRRRLSCTTVPSRYLQQLSNVSRPNEHTVPNAHKMLKAIHCTRRAFAEVDYLLIPYVNPQTDHGLLTGIAPAQRFVFVLDSVRGPPVFGNWRPNENIVLGLRDLVLSQLEPFKYAANNRRMRSGEWRVYRQ